MQVRHKPRVLFLAYYFPPVNAIACVRTWNMAKYLARQGWHVTVVTPEPSLWRHVEHSDTVERVLQKEGIQRLPTTHRWLSLSPVYLRTQPGSLRWLGGGICRRVARYLNIEREIGWLKEAEEACASLKPADVDVIFATGSPFLAFKLAKRLSVRVGRPYVLDYRDLWTDNLHAVRTPRLTTLREEAALLKDSAAVTIVSASWGAILEKRFGIGLKLHIISNGYDPDELFDVKAVEFDHFSIVYTGNFYPPKRVITPLMAALQRLRAISTAQSPQWTFHYYGTDEHIVRQEAEHFGVMDKVVLHGNIPRDEVLRAVKGASVAVVITSVTTDATLADKGMITGKVFEAVGLKTPILLIAPSGSDAETVVEGTGLGRRFLANDIDSIVQFLKNSMYSRISNTTNCDKYSWVSIINELDIILRKAIHTTL